MSLKRFLRRGRWDDERRQELDAYIALETEDNIARGMSPAAAQSAARRKLGNVTLIREEIYRMNTMGVLDAVWRDVRHAARLLRLNPLFASVAIVSLGLGIGANTAIFTLVNEFLLRTLPVRNPEELVLLRSIEGTGGRMSRGGENNGSIDPVTGRNSSTSFSLLAFERFRAQPTALSHVFAFAPISQPTVIVDGEPETTATAQLVSGNYHAGLGVAPRAGRLLTNEDDQSSSPPVAVISYRYWDARFRRDPAVVGKAITVNRVPVVIVGVTPPGFAGAAQAGESPDVSLPLAHYLRLQPTRVERVQPWYWWLRIMGRLAPGATPASARASLEPIFQDAAREGWLAGGTRDDTPRPMPPMSTLAADSGSQGESNTRRQYARSLYILMGLVGLVLAAACANVANLLLARGAARRREIALRLALGAGRVRIVGQLLAESLLLASAGAALGVLLAWWGRPLLLALRPFGNTAVVLDLPLDARVLGFTIAIAFTTAILFGLAPALRATRVDLTAEFQGGARTIGGGSRTQLSRALMVVQIALSVVLLVSTGLFVRTLARLEAVDAGFNRRNLVLFGTDAVAAGYAPDQFAVLHARLRQRLEGIPGVRTATFSRVAVLSRVRQNNTISVPGSSVPPGAFAPNMNGVAPNFFAAMELPLVLGRGFTAGDDAAAPRVAVVNQALAAKYFDRENPIGRRISYTLGPSAAGRVEVEVVGVAGDAKYTDLRTAVPPTLYLPALQQPGGNANFALRVDGNPAAVFAAIRAAVREIDPAMAVLDLRTQDEQIDRLHWQERLFARLSAFFGLLALALTCVGLYGLMSYAVLRRTGEIGLRMALGAPPGAVLRMMLGESLALVTVGVVCGVGAAYGCSRLVASMLYGLSPSDPSTYGVVVAALTAVAMLASYLPARRASRLQPTEALREE